MRIKVTTKGGIRKKPQRAFNGLAVPVDRVRNQPDQDRLSIVFFNIPRNRIEFRFARGCFLIFGRKNDHNASRSRMNIASLSCSCQPSIRVHDRVELALVPEFQVKSVFWRILISHCGHQLSNDQFEATCRCKRGTSSAFRLAERKW